MSDVRFPKAAAFLLVAPSLAAACAQADPAPAGPPASLTISAQDFSCTGPASVDIRFGSYAMGIDRSAAAVEREVARSSPVEIIRTPPAREGEYALCARMASAEAAAALFDRIGTLLPADPTGPIFVVHAGRESKAPRREAVDR